MDDLSLTRMISDRFSIDSGGKSPRRRAGDSASKRYFSRMVPQTLSFDDAAGCSSSKKGGEGASKKPIRDKENFDPSEDARTSAEFYDFASRPAKLSFDLECGFESFHDPGEEAMPFQSKYEIISTDSPDVCTLTSRNFQFGSPIDSFGDSEASECFNAPNAKVARKPPARTETTRMLDFDRDVPKVPFKFLPPNLLKRGEKTPLKKDIDDVDDSSPDAALRRAKKKLRTDSGIGGEPTSPFLESPLRRFEDDETDSGLSVRSSKRSLRTLDFLSASSLESGCVSETEESIFDTEEPAVDGFPTSFEALISGEIKGVLGDTPNKMAKAAAIRKPQERPSFRRCISLQAEQGKVERARTALFASPSGTRKRAEQTMEEDVIIKRPRNEMSSFASEFLINRPILQRTMSDNEASIKMALAHNDSDLIGDFSKPYCLPLEVSQHDDLKAISGETLASLIDGTYKETVDSFQVIDCRYPYEYDGGHIVGAKNLFTEELVRSHLLSEDGVRTSRAANRNILVFHCEFSFERGPKMCRFLRRADRALNNDAYPSLAHPELYVLRGGYKSFHARYAHHCRPAAGSYTSMSDPRFASSLKFHRSTSSRKIL